MPDVEKVIKGLECCVAYDYKCNDCPYQDDGGAEDGCYSDELKADAIAILKAQEPVKPTWRRGLAFCSSCGRQFCHGFKYCPDCGRPVKWR